MKPTRTHIGVPGAYTTSHTASNGSCPQQAFDEAPSQDLWHRGTECDSGATVTLFSQRARARYHIQRHPCLSLMHTVLYTNENAAKMALPRTHWHEQLLTA